MISWHPIDGPLMAGRTTIPPRHRDVEPAFIYKDQTFWLRKVWCQIIEELRSQFLTAFSGDQRFFYG